MSFYCLYLVCIVQINSKFVTKNMFWNFCMQPNVYYATVLPLIVPTVSNTAEVTGSNQAESPSTPEPVHTKTPLLNLTVKDLMKAGYENNKRPWTEDEDVKLKELRDEGKLEWSQISRQIQGRNPKMCYNRYRRLENHTKELWTKKQNEKLCQLVQELGENWKQISKQFKTRTHKQLKEHYLNYLRPQIKKDEWSIEQDLNLISLLNKFGKNWKYLESKFNGRTQNQIKNRYFGRLKKLSERKTNRGAEPSDSEEIL